jgi:F-type H+-transporting ATPase subunit delta
MNESQISVRYARALYQSAEDKGLLDRVYQDMELLEEVTGMEDFRYMILLPSLQPGQKFKIAGLVLEKHISGLSLAMIRLVLDNKREAYLEGIARNFREFYRKASGIRHARLVTAQPAGKQTIEKIRALISETYESGVELSTVVNEDIIGGFILTIEDRQYDASVLRSLKHMREKLLQTSIEK